jgi:hypothetical protein
MRQRHRGFVVLGGGRGLLPGALTGTHSRGRALIGRRSETALGSLRRRFRVALVLRIRFWRRCNVYANVQVRRLWQTLRLNCTRLGLLGRGCKDDWLLRPVDIVEGAGVLESENLGNKRRLYNLRISAKKKSGQRARRARVAPRERSAPASPPRSALLSGTRSRTEDTHTAAAMRGDQGWAQVPLTQRRALPGQKPPATGNGHYATRVSTRSLSARVRASCPPIPCGWRCAKLKGAA